MFPEIRQAFKDWWSRQDQPIQTLGLKSNETLQHIGFDPVSIASYSRNGYNRIAEALGWGGPSWSGEMISPQTALNNSVAWACTRIISETQAFMPLSMMQQRDGAKQVAEKHPMHQALHNAPNEEMTSMSFRESLTGHVVTRGNCYAEIIRRSGTDVAYELNPLQPSQVYPARNKKKQLVYVVKDGNSADKTYTVERGKPHKILHIRGLGSDGIVGYSVITMARHSLGAAQSVEKYAGKFFAQGGRQPGYIKLAQKFRTDQEQEQFRADFEKFYNEPGNFHRVPILPPSIEFSPYAWSPHDSQFLEARQFEIPEICRWFLISPHLVGDLSRATFSNIEHLALQFVKMTMTAWITRWEQELWRCILTPEEKGQGYFFKHNLNGLLRGDFQSRMAGYATLLQNGIASVNEVRDLEDWNPIEGGDDHHIQLNMQSLPGGTPTASQQAALFKLGGTRNGNETGKASA